MSVEVSVDLHHAEIQALLHRRVALIGARVQVVARRRAPKATGRLMASISMSATSGGPVVAATVGTPLAYGFYQHEGTGIYATGRPIRPRRARFMRFLPSRPVGPVQGGGKFTRTRQRGGPGWVFAREVKGVPPNSYLTSALADVVGVHPGTRIRRGSGRGRRG